MAHNVEPMDIDNIDSDFDNKENSIHHSNVYPRTPCTEKGYEELDVSELNMKLRYSVTPASSPMSKSYTANCVDNKHQESGDEHINSNLTRSFNDASYSKGDVANKSLKSLPLQPITAGHFQDNSRNASVLRSLDTTMVTDTRNVTITVTDNENYENFELPSSSSSAAQTPEVTTPTKELPRTEGGSPIMRGLKTVLNMFRSSQSPIPLGDSGDSAVKQILSPADATPDFDSRLQPTQSVLASTPIAPYKSKETTSLRNSPHKDSIVFNEDLEKELLWKDETTILFSEEKIPIHKLFYQQSILNNAGPTKSSEAELPNHDDKCNSTVEYMDISYNDSIVKDKSITEMYSEVSINVGESDGEFVDCETTFTEDKNETSHVGGSTKEGSLENDELPQEETTQSSPSLQQTLSEANTTNVISSISNDIAEPHESSMTKGPMDENMLKAVKTTFLVMEKSETLSAIVTDKSISVSNILSLETDHNLKTDNKEVFLPADTYKNVIDEQVALSLNEIEEFSLNKPNVSVLNNTIEDHSVLPELVQASFVVPKQSGSTEVSYANTIDSIISENNAIAKEINEPVESKNELIEETAHAENVISPAIITTAENNSIFNNQFNESVISVNKTDNDLPGDVPLPDEDDFDTVKPIISKNMCPDINSINNNTIDTKLQSTEHIVNMLIETTDPAKSLNAYEANDSNKDVILATNIVVKDVENNLHEKSIPDQKNNIDITFAKDYKPDYNLTLDIITDIDNIISDAQLFVNDQQNKLTLNSLDSELSDNFDTNKNYQNIEQSLTNNQCKIFEIRKNEAIGNALQQQSQVLSKEISNDNMSELELQNVGKCSEVVEHHSQTLSDDNKLSNSIQSDLNKVNTEQTMTSLEYQSLENKHNEADLKALQLQSNVLSEEICNENLQQVEKFTEDVAFNLQLLSNDTNNKDTKYNMSVDDDKEMGLDIDLQPFENALINSTNATLAINDTLLIKQNVIETNSEIKLELLPDVPPTEATDAPDEISVDNAKIELEVTREKHEIYNTQEIISLKINETQIINKDEIEDNIDEEIILSENNSPYVSIAGDINTTEKQPIENIDIPFVTKTNVAISPPISPKIVSKGYNFNFDEMDDPFATKTKIRVSPPLDSSKDNFTDPVDDKFPQREINKNSRKSQPYRKKSVVPKKAIKSFSGPVNVVEQDTANLLNTNTYQPLQTTSEPETNVTHKSFMCSGAEADVLEKPTHVLDPVASSVTETLASEIEVQGESNIDLHEIIATKSLDHNDTVSISNEVFASGEALTETKTLSLESPINSNEVGQTSSSEQSVYYSAATSSVESANNRNVFNIPEIDDMNFNPFITKPRVRQSPPPGKDDSFNFNNSSEANKLSDAYEDKECANASNTTCSSKTTDEKDITVCEVHTEDEDTIEGPFLEVDDLNKVDKISDFDGEDVDMMQFSELPPQINDENLEGGEMFIDADAFEFLLNQNKTNVVADSGKESLFLKFDPLFAKRVSTDGVLAALKKVQKDQSTLKKVSVAQQLDTTFENSIDGPSTLNTAVETTNVTVGDSTEELNVTVSKPMMAVTPAVNSIVTPRKKSTTPTSSNRRSITFTSPAIAVIDRLLSLSSNNSFVGHDTTITQVSREQNEADLALTQLRELLAEKEINVYNLRSESKDLKNRLTSLESQMRTLETESEERLKKVNELNEKLSEKTKLNKSMAAVVEEYERTIASLIAETEQDKKRNSEERIKLIKERDEQTAHLASMEVSFSDLHSKYEKSKQIILTCKANEDAYKKSIKDFEDNLSKMQSNYELLKQHATSKLNHANQELEKMNRAHEADVLKLNAMIKRKDLHITSLEETLAQKTKANEELTAICDELINKVG